MYSNYSTVSDKYPFGIHSFGLTEEQQEAKAQHFVDLIKNAKPDAAFPKNRWQFDILAELLYDNFPRAATLHFFSIEYVYYFVNRYHFGHVGGLPERTKRDVKQYLNALIEDGFLTAWGEYHYKKTARTHYIEPEPDEPKDEESTHNAYGRSLMLERSEARKRQAEFDTFYFEQTQKKYATWKKVALLYQGSPTLKVREPGIRWHDSIYSKLFCEDEEIRYAEFRATLENQLTKEEGLNFVTQEFWSSLNYPRRARLDYLRQIWRNECQKKYLDKEEIHAIGPVVNALIDEENDDDLALLLYVMLRFDFAKEQAKQQAKKLWPDLYKYISNWVQWEKEDWFEINKYVAKMESTWETLSKFPAHRLQLLKHEWVDGQKDIHRPFITKDLRQLIDYVESNYKDRDTEALLIKLMYPTHAHSSTLAHAEKLVSKLAEVQSC